MIGFGPRDMTIPPPSVLSNYVDNDSDYVTDPDKIRDELPQPYRLVDKISDFIFDIAWDVITKQEDVRIAEASKIKPPKFECQIEIGQIDARCMNASADGEYIFIGLSNGLAVVNTATSDIVDQYEEELFLITEINSSILDDGLYLVSTIDIQGISRLFVFHGEAVLLAKMINENTPSQGPTVNKCIISYQSDYMGVSLNNQATGESWLEIHKLPKDAWIKEVSSLKGKSSTKLEKEIKAEERIKTPEPSESEPTITDDIADSESVKADQIGQDNKSQQNFRLSATTILLKIKSPQAIKPSTASSVFNAFKVIEANADVVSTGQNHILNTAHIEDRNSVFKLHRDDLMKYLPEDSPIDCIPNFHFIAATRFSPSGRDGSKPTSVVVHWGGKNQVMIYSLTKQAKDVHYKPDQVWPFPHNISASAVSSCSLMLAVGLENGSVIVWDLYTGLQRRLLNVSNTAIIHLDFMDPSITRQHINPSSPYQTNTSCFVLALSDDGQLCFFDTTMGTIVAAIVVVPSNSTVRPEKVTILPGMPQLILTTYTDGRIYLEDVLKRSRLCEIAVPHPHQLDEVALATVCAKGEFLFFKTTCAENLVKEGHEAAEAADCDDDESVEESIAEDITELKDSVFCLHTLKFPVLETYWNRARADIPYLMHATIDKRLDCLMQRRIEMQPIRQARLQASWGQLADTLQFIKKLQDDKNPTATHESRLGASTFDESIIDSPRSPRSPNRVTLLV